ncbi:oxygen-independent coproporphyrinogen III oxidase [Snodgrassella alvi]|uniref:Coproporphyrinogen-III oxidase n=1 Tax=Snodgrassella alvi TaxID=1196083 RepID=A0A2N9WRU3_9NEIS|nr:oxygen-independent coproporphyrinogen III oxidase [Snodgrassella alvi]PIT13007.1 oxygen-independent coproporphyrinogen III oxidase [Snodgrassella alvi]
MNTPRINIEFDRTLIASLPASGPRYTSYPTADRFNSNFVATQLQTALQQHIGSQPVSLYVHVPFCNTICYYCGCNKIITKDTSRADLYIQYLDKELALLAQNWQGKPLLAQLHFGGGTPTFLNDDQLSHIFASISRYFTLTSQGEYSIEIDPRKVTARSVAHLGELGFNRMSVGIQDFNPTVQQAVNRIQSKAETRAVIEAARNNGFQSVSVDLIYGLPHQTEASMRCTLDHVLELQPDRIAMYHYAHLPHLFKPQRRIDTAVVPDSSVKLDILQNTVQYLLQQGYIFIGMDHFAKPDDELAIALSEGRLQRNFQGYSTHADCDLIAIGVSSIGKIANIYSQNEKELSAYYQALDENRLPVMRGYQLNADDLLRRQVIQDLMCRFQLNYHDYSATIQQPFQTYFATEQADLQQLAQLGLLSLTDQQLQVTPKGRLLIRNIAMVFDYHLRQKRTEAQYSRTL